VWSLANVAGMRLPSFCARTEFRSAPTRWIGSSARPATRLRDQQPEGRPRISPSRRTECASPRRSCAPEHGPVDLEPWCRTITGTTTFASACRLWSEGAASNGSCAWDLSPHEARGVRKSAEVLRQTIDSPWSRDPDGRLNLDKWQMGVARSSRTTRQLPEAAHRQPDKRGGRQYRRHF